MVAPSAMPSDSRRRSPPPMPTTTTRRAWNPAAPPRARRARSSGASAAPAAARPVAPRNDRRLSAMVIALLEALVLARSDQRADDGARTDRVVGAPLVGERAQLVGAGLAAEEAAELLRDPGLGIVDLGL